MKEVVALILLAAMLTGCDRSEDIAICEQSWRRVFMPSLDRLSAKLEIDSLGSAAFSPGEREIRVWEDKSRRAPHALTVIAYRQEQWRASVMSTKGPRTLVQLKGRHKQIQYIWEYLETSGFLSLPDDCEFEGRKYYRGRTNYVVEYKHGDRYRSFRYVAPEFQGFSESKNFLQLLRKLYDRVNKLERVEQIPQSVPLDSVIPSALLVSDSFFQKLRSHAFPKGIDEYELVALVEGLSSESTPKMQAIKLNDNLKIIGVFQSVGPNYNMTGINVYSCINSNCNLLMYQTIWSESVSLKVDYTAGDLLVVSESNAVVSKISYPWIKELKTTHDDTTHD